MLMTTQTNRPKSPHLLNLIFSPQHREFTVDAPPDECVERLLTLSRFDRKVKITEMDSEQGYNFKIDIRRNFKGEYTSTTYKGFFVRKPEVEKTFIRYSSRTGPIMFFLLAITFIYIWVSIEIVRRDPSLNLIALFGFGGWFLIGYTFIRQIKEDHKFGSLLSTTLTSSTSPEAKSR